MDQHIKYQLNEHLSQYSDFGCCVCDVATGDEILIEDIDDSAVVELIALHQRFDEDTHICRACLESKKKSAAKTEMVRQEVKERLGG